MLAGDTDPDYVFFGRLDGDTDTAIFPKAFALAEWWAELFAIPAMVMGGSSLASVRRSPAMPGSSSSRCAVPSGTTPRDRAPRSPRRTASLPPRRNRCRETDPRLCNSDCRDHGVAGTGTGADRSHAANDRPAGDTRQHGAGAGRNRQTSDPADTSHGGGGRTSNRTSSPAGARNSGRDAGRPDDAVAPSVRIGNAVPRHRGAGSRGDGFPTHRRSRPGKNSGHGCRRRRSRLRRLPARLLSDRLRHRPRTRPGRRHRRPDVARTDL